MLSFFSVHLILLGVQMSSIQQRRSTATDTRLAVVINAAANLNVQLLELNRLRDLVRNAQLSARKSPQLHKRKRIPA
ncbi:MAG TPA: hypothetical protein VEN78_09100 [Bradyrhizobium sp.]|nr:hypothetical protein [Bradyrhizobium sp.]